MTPRRRLGLAALLTFSLAACAGDAEPGGDGAPTATEDPVAGDYAIESHLDLATAEGVPTPVHDALALLRGRADDPAGTIFAMIDAANLPLVDQLLAALPPIVVDQVAGFIDQFVVA